MSVRVCVSLSHTHTHAEAIEGPCPAIPIGFGLEQGKPLVSMCGQIRGASVSVNVPKKAWLLIGFLVPLGQGLGCITV